MKRNQGRIKGHGKVESKVMTKFECKDKDKAGSTGMTDMQFRFKSNK